MTRLLALLAATALIAAAFATTASAVPAPSDRSQAKRYAKAVIVNKTKKAGMTLRSSDIKMVCVRVRRGRYYRCGFETTNGRCSGDLRVYAKRYGFKAKKVRIGCVSEDPPSAG